MFLAFRELRKEKTRFILITVVIVLVSYLTLFLTSLAYGLATSYTQGLDGWKAAGIILSEDANDSVARSRITKEQYNEVFDSATMAFLGVGGAIVELDEQQEVALFGVDKKSFLLPEVTEGKAPEGQREVVVDDSLKQYGLTLGTEFSLKGADDTYVVAGFTSNATFQTQPLVYMALETWRSAVAATSGMIGMRDDTTVSAIITKNQPAIGQSSGLSWQTIRDFSFKLPGYNAQVLTFSLMIGFLIAIAAFVLAIFMYILTLQKKGIFGVLKAEGVSNAYIARSVVIQALLLTGGGLLTGLVLAFTTGIVLPDTVPFMINPIFYGGVVTLFIVFSVIGSLASVLSVTKIDPVEAIQ